MTKQIGSLMVAAGIMFFAAGILINSPSVGITGNVVTDTMGFNDYAAGSALGLSIMLLLAGFVFYFRVRPGE
jgi:hypothetical protein